MGNIFLIRQLDKKMRVLLPLKDAVVPSGGWIKAIRTSLNMSLRQLGNRIAVTPQSVKKIEDREAEKAVTLNTLHIVADALDMRLVYGFIPKDGSLEDLVTRQATRMAYKIVLRAHTTMELEEQGIDEEDTMQAIRELAEELKREMPKSLWD